jgi:hypothetical protein
MRSKDIKYLGFGLGIGISMMGLFLGTAFFIPGFRNRVLASQPTSPQTTALLEVPSTITPTLPPISTETVAPINLTEYTSTPTQIPLASETPLPVITPTLSTAELLAATGDLSIVGPLTREQQLALYNAALTFIAPTYAESKRMSVEINNLRFSDPSTTCGPLSLAILKKAGLISQDVVPHDFFLLNPSLGKDRQLLQTILTKDRFTNTRFPIRLDKFDWVNSPLMPGDFLYIYGGTEGNFDHMLVVSRVDSQGRAYSVTNYNTDQGFVINETLLYDPNDPTVGIFELWTRKPKQILGSTGYSGFEVWRLKQ